MVHFDCTGGDTGSETEKSKLCWEVDCVNKQDELFCSGFGCSADKSEAVLAKKIHKLLHMKISSYQAASQSHLCVVENKKFHFSSVIALNSKELPDLQLLISSNLL